jgi:hypothetical protein
MSAARVMIVDDDRVLTEIRKLRPDARIVMMTGGKEPITRRTIEAGALGRGRRRPPSPSPSPGE